MKQISNKSNTNEYASSKLMLKDIRTVLNGFESRILKRKLIKQLII
jgi:hypothetical protein